MRIWKVACCCAPAPVRVSWAYSVEGTPNGILKEVGYPLRLGALSLLADKRALALLPIGTRRGLSAKKDAIPRSSFPRFCWVAVNGVGVPLVEFYPIRARGRVPVL